MSIRLIITGHGHYASGIESSLSLLAGKNEEVSYVDFLEEDSDVSLKEKIMKVLVQHDSAQFLLVCDIVGGTPFNVCAAIANGSDNIETVGGCNVMGILETIFQKDNMTLPGLADFIIDTTKQGAAKFKKIDVNKIIINSTPEDGI